MNGERKQRAANCQAWLGTHQPMPTRVSNRERTRWRDPERQSFDGIKVSAATRSERDDSILPDLLNCL
jgi:hypothetical protein